ncbi:PREDICTED: serine/arginine-rich splicing factor 2-like, partial [Galeopterus variegatus]|uniref:Serine/arginine-rich splicing factor 2 n=1 Tax=Galeopterus variegatus TaxID=482537 RepID=A0ABM0Q5B8_GALVR
MSYSHPPLYVESMTSLKVGNVTYRTSANTLRPLFEKYGCIGDVYIPRDCFTKEPRGFAFVRFLYKHHAQDAMDALDGIVLDGRVLRVQMAHCSHPTYGHHSSRSRCRLGFRPRSRSHVSCLRSRSRSRSPSRSHRRSSSTPRSGSTQRSISTSSSVSRSRSWTGSSSGSRSLPPGCNRGSEAGSRSKSTSKSPEEERV